MKSYPPILQTVQVSETHIKQHGTTPGSNGSQVAEFVRDRAVSNGSASSELYVHIRHPESLLQLRPRGSLSAGLHKGWELVRWQRRRGSRTTLACRIKDKCLGCIRHGTGTPAPYVLMEAVYGWLGQNTIV